MQDIFDKAYTILEEIKSSTPKNADELEQFRIKYLGTKGVLKELFGAMGQLPGDKKKEYGQLMNTLKATAEAKLEELKAGLDNNSSSQKEIPDLTAPGYDIPVG